MKVGIEDGHPDVRVLCGEVAADVRQGEGVGTVGHDTGEGRRQVGQGGRVQNQRTVWEGASQMG